MHVRKRWRHLLYACALWAPMAGAQHREPGELPSIGDLRDSSAYGRAVAIAGRSALAGAPLDTVDGQPVHGRVAIFRRSIDGEYRYEGDLVSSHATAHSCFGLSIVMDADLAVVGAPGCDDPFDSSAPRPPPGFVEVFRNIGSRWISEGTLSVPGHFGGELFGFAVGLDARAGRMAVGTFADEGGLGAVYIFDRAGDSGWTPVTRIVSPTGGLFGFSVAITGDDVIVGAPLSGRYGTALAFQRGARNEYTLTQELAPSGVRTVAEWFGWSVTAREGLLAVGAPFAESGSIASEGAVALYKLSGARWQQTGSLLPPTPLRTTGARFGWAAALFDGGLFVGAPGTNECEGCQRPNLGAVHSYRLTGAGDATYVESFLGDESNAELGSAVAGEDGRGIAGAIRSPTQRSAFALRSSGLPFDDSFDGAIARNECTAAVPDDESHRAHPFACMRLH